MRSRLSPTSYSFFHSCSLNHESLACLGRPHTPGLVVVGIGHSLSPSPSLILVASDVSWEIPWAEWVVTQRRGNGMEGEGRITHWPSNLQAT